MRFGRGWILKHFEKEKNGSCVSWSSWIIPYQLIKWSHFEFLVITFLGSPQQVIILNIDLVTSLLFSMVLDGVIIIIII